MSQATIRNSKRNLGHKVKNSKRNLGHILLRIENSKHLSNIYSYLISILIYILYYTILYTILYTIHTIYTIYFYEVYPLCIQPYIYAYDPSHIYPNFTIFGTKFSYSQPILTRVCYSLMHITALSSTLIPCDPHLISHSILPPSCLPPFLRILHHTPPPQG